jgi:PPOX class probable F420-dependent enzyme
MRLTADEARRRFATARVARLATITSDGRPHLVPMTFAVADDTIFSIVDAKPKASPDLARLRNMRGNPRVAVLVDEYGDEWDGLWWVRAEGRASVAEEGSDRERALELLRAKYPQYADPSVRFGAATIIQVDLWVGWAVRG